MPKRVCEEVRIMEALRALPQEKREVVLNLAQAEFRAKPVRLRSSEPSSKKGGSRKKGGSGESAEG